LLHAELVYLSTGQ